MLQYNFVNSSGEPWMPDHLTLYDGDLYNLTTKPIVTIKVDGNEAERSLYETTRSNPLSIKFHATGKNFISIYHSHFIYYRIIAETPRPLLYREFEYNSRKIAKNILCYLVKLEYNLRKFD